MTSDALRALLATNKRSSTSADVSERSVYPISGIVDWPDVRFARQKRPFR
jgi:hypothetical protein